MIRKFNDVGLCVPHRHYMVDISPKIEQIVRMIDLGEYFTINRPRQFGKTTVLGELANQLNGDNQYLALNISFEDIDTETYQYQERFIRAFLYILMIEFEAMALLEQAAFVQQHLDQVTDMLTLSHFITQLVHNAPLDKAVVLFIDEVDKSSNNQLFLDFLGTLRKKYLRRNAGKEDTFQSVILAGVHDIKTLKAKLRTSSLSSEGGYNSPWNIAVDFKIDLSFAPTEIETMLRDYSQAQAIPPDIPAIAQKIYYYTSGYPYLVSKLCKFIAEDIIPRRDDKNWSVTDVDAAFKMIVDKGYTTTLFDSLTKNLENNQNLYDTVFNLIINGQHIPFDIEVPVINLGYMYGIFKNMPQGCQIHNRIYEQRIYSYMLTKLLTSQTQPWVTLHPDYYTDQGLNLPFILQKFQAFMKEHYAHKETKFLEREGRLLFLSFLRPIINGKGFDFKEPHVGDERRMDFVVTFQHKRYVIELKIWRGPKYHQTGLQQLSDYLDTYGLQKGYLLVYDFSREKTYKQETIVFDDKHIFAVWV